MLVLGKPICIGNKQSFAFETVLISHEFLFLLLLVVVVVKIKWGERRGGGRTARKRENVCERGKVASYTSGFVLQYYLFPREIQDALKTAKPSS